MKLKNLYTNEVYKEKQLLADNYEKVVDSNNDFTKVILKIGGFCFFMLFITSMFIPSYYNLRIVYFSVFLILAAFYLLIKLREKYVGIWSIYVVFTAAVVCFTLTGSFITQNDIGVMVLALLLTFPIIVLDKSIRIILTEFFFLVFYISMIYLHKAPLLVIDEIVNSIFSFVLGVTLGEYFRIVRLKNFELERQAHIRETTDVLTQLFNKRKLFDFFIEYENGVYKEPVTAMSILDIDDFKLYNDTYGHQTGDDCLRQIGLCLKKLEGIYHLTFYRYGGEEFVAVLHDPDIADISSVFEKINQAVRNLNISHSAVSKGVVTVSIGVVPIKYNCKPNFEQLLDNADKALYSAKRTGKDKTVIFCDDFNEPDIHGHYSRVHT